MNKFDIYYYPWEYQETKMYNTPTTKERPIILIKIVGDIFVIASMITTKHRNTDYEIINWKESGLSRPSWIRFENSAVIDKDKLQNHIGHLDEYDVHRIMSNKKYKKYVESFKGENKMTKVKRIYEDVFKDWKPNTNFSHIKQIYNKVKSNNYKYVNNEREEMNAAVDKADKGGYTPEQRKQIRDMHQDIWKHNRNVNESSSFDSIGNDIKKIVQFNKIVDCIENTIYDNSDFERDYIENYYTIDRRVTNNGKGMKITIVVEDTFSDLIVDALNDMFYNDSYLDVDFYINEEATNLAHHIGEISVIEEIITGTLDVKENFNESINSEPIWEDDVDEKGEKIQRLVDIA